MNNVLYIHFALGPLMIILAYLYKRFPPRKINNWYGYRTQRSMRSQAAWDRANHYSANAFLVVSCLTLVTQLVTGTLLDVGQSMIWSSTILVIGVISVIPLTEAHLKKEGFV